MKTARFNFLLGPLVLLIWVGVGIRLSSGCSRETAATGIKKPLEEGWSDVADTVEGHQLNLDYPDPFLATSKELPPVDAPVLVVGSVLQKAVSAPSWTFLGGVRSTRGEGITGLLRMASRIWPVHAGQTLDGWEVKALSLDTLTLTRQGQTFRLGRKAYPQHVQISP